MTHQTLTPSLEKFKLLCRNPVQFAQHLLKIQDKEMETVPLSYNPIQKNYLRQRTSRDLILKPRQIGFTTAIQAEFFRYQITRASSTMTLGKDDENTKELRRIADHYYDEFPGEIKPYRYYNNGTLTTFPRVKSRGVIATAGSTNTGRGGTRTHIHGSEVAFWPDAQNIMKGAMQAGNPLWIVLESTPNGASGWYYDRCMEALEKPDKSIWRLHFYTWFDHPEYRLPLEPGETLRYEDDETLLVQQHGLTPEQIKWRRYKIAEIGNLDDFLQEYPEDPYTCFKKSGASYFGNIDHAFTAPMGATYNPAYTYYAGLDFGQQQDFTAMPIGCVETKEQVDLLHINHERWDEMRRQIREKCKHWHVQVLVGEKNSIGSVNLEALHTEFYNEGLETSIIPFDMTFVSKPPLMASLRTALHEQGFKLLPIPVQKHEFSSAVTKETMRGWTVETPRDKKADGQPQGHGDTVVGTALLWHAMTFASASINVTNR